MVIKCCLLDSTHVPTVALLGKAETGGCYCKVLTVDTFDWGHYRGKKQFIFTLSKLSTVSHCGLINTFVIFWHQTSSVPVVPVSLDFPQSIH